MVDPAVATVLVEGAKLALQSYFNYMRLAGASEEEKEALYQSEKATFEANKPSDLPDI